MIGRLRGYAERYGDDSVLLDVQGVGYHVFVTTRTQDAVARNPRQEMMLYIVTHVREDHFHLYGFTDVADKNCFTLLTTVQGVGNKMALAVLSLFSATDIHNAIMAQDTATFTRVSGVGKRIAERIVVELKTKLPALPVVSSASSSSAAPSMGDVTDTIIQDALLALEQLGYARMDAHRVVAMVRQQHPDAALDQIITHSLQQLAG